jgi:transcriptional regulator with XRE-family HTH domain
VIRSIYSRARKKIAKNLRAARLQKGLTQNEVARALGCTQSYVSKVEAGQVRVDAVQLSVFSRLYGVRLNSLV